MRAILKVGMREGGQIAFHFSKLLTFRYCKGQFPSTHLLIDKLVCKGTQSTTLLYALHVYMILAPCHLTYIQPIIYNCIIQCIIIQIHKMPVCGHSSHTHTHQLCGDQTLISLLHSMHALDGWWWMMIYAHTPVLWSMLLIVLIYFCFSPETKL